MIQALQTQAGPLPQGFIVQNTYTELRKGSRKAVMVVRNNTAYLQTLQKKTPGSQGGSCIACAQNP